MMRIKRPKARAGRKLSWEDARKEWTDKHREKYEAFLMDTMTFSDSEGK